MSSRLTCLGPQIVVPEPNAAVVDLLGLLRRRTGMDLAWLGRFDGRVLVLQALNGNPHRFRLSRGCSVRYEEGLFSRVLTGTLPPLIPDTHRDRRTAALAPVHELGVGAYAATPVCDATGATYGLLGCLSREPRPSLGDRDARLLRLLAEFLTDYVSDLRKMWEIRSRIWSGVQDMIDEGGPQIAYQPVVDLRTGRVVAVEALSRLPGSPRRPASLFTEAADVGLGPELEIAAIQRALAVLPDLPVGVRLAVNASPSTVTSGLVGVLLRTGVAERIAVEITENEYIGDDGDLTAAISTLRGNDVRIVVDDMGTCYAGLQLVLHLRPDVIKLDRFIVRGLPDPAHQAVVAGVTTIARAIGSHVVAEGIETATELAAAREATIDYGQGFLLGHPTADIHAACLPISLEQPAMSVGEMSVGELPVGGPR